MTEFWRSVDLPYLESRRSCQENSCYRPHSHEALSIGLIEDGASALSGPMDGIVDLQPGDVVVIPADHVHACNPTGGRWRYQMTHVRTEAAPTPIIHRSVAIAEIVVMRSPAIGAKAAALSDSMFDGQPGVERRLGELLDAIVAGTPETTVPGRRDVSRLALLEPVFSRLLEDAANPRLDELGELVGMDRYRLIRAVKDATGLSPLAWRQNARIRRARELLRNGHTIAETANTLGFADQSHFHRVFRAHVAASPGRYRAEPHARPA